MEGKKYQESVLEWRRPRKHDGEMPREVPGWALGQKKEEHMRKWVE